jgi:hypothetical protein
MRILQTNLKAFVKDNLLSIRTACEEAIAQGLIVELPLFADFSVEVVQNAAGVTQLTTTAAPAETTTEEAHAIVTNEATATDTTTVSRDVNQRSDESGEDRTVDRHDYGDYA